MALVPDQKFSTFDNGGDLQVGDIIVGLRNGLNTRFNYTGQLPLGFIVPVSQGGTDANNVVDARTNLGLGTMATQNANNVNITGGVAALTSLTLATALAKASGGTGVTSATTTPTANEFAAWDADSNLRANNFIEGFATTATAGGTTTLTVSSAGIQEFTGTLTQTVVMPVTTTLIAGHQFAIINNSSGNLTINSSGGNLILTMAANTTAFITCVVASGTGAASWNASYVFDQGAGVLSITGTANQIAASSSTGNVTLSLPAALDFPGTFTVQNTVDIDEILDEDNMASNSATALATQQSIKAYVDNFRAAGAILQTVSTNLTGTFSASLASGSGFTDVTGLNVAITPSSTSNKVLIQCDMIISSDTADIVVNVRLKRNGTPIDIGSSAGSRIQITTGSTNTKGDDGLQAVSFSFLDSPSTTSSITYQVDISQRTSGSSVGVYVNRSAVDTNSSSYCRGASTITAQEIKG